MKNKQLYILLALVIGLGMYFLFLKKNEGSSNAKPNSDFAIADTAKIDKIIITDQDNNQVVLKREDWYWSINEKFRARDDAVQLLLKTFKQIKVQRSVPDSAFNNVMRAIATTHKKVDIYQGGNKPVKTYFVGTATKDQYGTYMLLETEKEGRSSVPYVTELPTFYGHLNTRFFVDLNEWKHTGVFMHEPSKINTITLTNNVEPKQSFKVEMNHKVGKTILFDGNNNPVNKYDTALLNNYIIYYKKIHYNKILPYSQTEIDSVKALTPHYIIKLNDINNKTTEVKLYKVPALDGQKDIYGLPMEWSPNVLNACINNSNEIVRVQYYTWDKLLRNLNYFAL